MSQGIEIQLMKILNSTVDNVEKVAGQEFKELAKEGQKMLKARSPRRTGAYASSWKISNRKEEIIIYNQSYWMLTHLLEKGHATKNGGRVPGIKHISTVEEWIEAEIPKRLQRALEK